MEVGPEEISKLRDEFFKKLKDEGSPDDKAFHPADIARITDGDDWLKRFLLHNELDMQRALQMLWKTCIWRRDLAVNDITIHNVKRELFDDGSLFSNGKDKDGCTLLILDVKKHVRGKKNMDDVKRAVLYWLERLERINKGKGITVVFDLTACGLSNADIEFVRYFLGLFPEYYPCFLNNIIIFNMPWILNATYLLIKSWLPQKIVAKLKVLDKKTINQYIDPEEALVSWGGSNDYTFQPLPESDTE